MKKSTKEEFIKKAELIHNRKYDYSNVEYVNSQTKVSIICPIHGKFLQTPAMHLSGNGCPKCKAQKQGSIQRKKVEDFVNEAKEIHGDKYDYSKVNYKNTHEKVCILCPKHGEFWQTPIKHLEGNGCPKCYGNVRLTTEEFVEKAKQIHGDKYDYSSSEYENSRTKLKIICKKHGEFWQTPHSHLNGDGCPFCKYSHLENEIKNMLEENNIVYEPQKRFSWLGKMSLDFYIPSKEIAIECQGSQHYIPYNFFGGKKCLEETKKRDQKKKELCLEHNINIVYYGHYRNCIKNKKIILRKILENDNRYRW